MKILHVYPLEDLREHNTDSKKCWCNPKLENCEGSIIVTHNSLDGREFVEEHGVN